MKPFRPLLNVAGMGLGRFHAALRFKSIWSNLSSMGTMVRKKKECASVEATGFSQEPHRNTSGSRKQAYRNQCMIKSVLSDKKWLLTLLLLSIYPILTIMQRSTVFGVPFDSETTHRFLIPYHFEDRANVLWTINESVAHGFTRPVYSLTFLLDYRLWGTDYRLYHLTDFVLSWITFAAVYLIFRKRFSAGVSLLTSVIWAMHPAQAYSMVSFTGRNDRLVTLFVLASIHLFNNAIESKQRRWEILCLLIACIGYFAKETSLPYLAIAFGWGWTNTSLSLYSAFKRNSLLWSLGILAFTILMATKHLLGVGLPSEFGLGLSYFLKFSRLLHWTLPFLLKPSVGAGILWFLALAFLSFWYKAGKAVRFGACLTLVSLAPFPLFWVQKTFLWLPSLGLALILAGVAEILWKHATRKSMKTVLALSGIAGLITLCWWGRHEAYESADASIAFKVAVRHLVDSQPGPQYNGESAVTAVPAILPYIAETGGPIASGKARLYLEQLVQLEASNPNATVIW